MGWDAEIGLREKLPRFVEGSSVSRIYDYMRGELASALDRQIDLLHATTPQEGAVIRFSVDADAKLIRAEIKRSSGSNEFDQEVLRVLSTVEIPVPPRGGPLELTFAASIDQLGLFGIKEVGLAGAIDDYSVDILRRTNFPTFYFSEDLRKLTKNVDSFDLCAYGIKVSADGRLEALELLWHNGLQTEALKFVDSTVARFIEHLSPLSEKLSRESIALILLIQDGNMGLKNPMDFFPFKHRELPFRQQRQTKIAVEETAKRHSQYLASLDPKSVSYLTVKAEACWRSGNFAEAKAFYEEAMNLHPYDPTPFRSYADHLLRAAEIGTHSLEFKTVNHLIAKYSELQPPNKRHIAMDRLSRLFALVGDHENSLFYIEKNVHATSAEYTRVAEILITKRNFDGAITILKAGIQAQKISDTAIEELADLSLHLTELLRKLGRDDEAAHEERLVSEKLESWGDQLGVAN